MEFHVQHLHHILSFVSRTDAFRLDVSGAGAALRIKEIADVSVVEIPLSNDYVDVDLGMFLTKTRAIRISHNAARTGIMVSIPHRTW